MKEKQSSTTAQGIALIRALESSRPAGERICYDPYARQLINPVNYLLVKPFVGYAERRGPGVVGFLVARCRYMDDYLQECIKAGLEQLVILGAGLDSRAYRFEHLLGKVKVFEVDHPATQQVKVKKLCKILGSLPGHVSFIPIDFNEETLQKLFDYGYRQEEKTLFIWEGVVHYLKAEAVDQTLAFVRMNSGRGSSIIFDYMYTSALRVEQKRSEVARMQRSRLLTGEGLTFGIEEGQVEEFLRLRGYTRIHNLSSQDLHRAYFSGVNQSRSVAPVYAIVHAVVG
jgi:methyltransferase (TIGR00027 family)